MADLSTASVACRRQGGDEVEWRSRARSGGWCRRFLTPWTRQRKAPLTVPPTGRSPERRTSRAAKTKTRVDDGENESKNRWSSSREEMGENGRWWVVVVWDGDEESDRWLRRKVEERRTVPFAEIGQRRGEQASKTFDFIFGRKLNRQKEHERIGTT